MHVLLAALLALQPATVIDVQANRTVTLALEFRETIYTAEFSLRDLNADSLKEGDRVQAEGEGRSHDRATPGREKSVGPGHSGTARAHSPTPLSPL